MVGVIGWIADDDGNFLPVLVLNAFGVFFGEGGDVFLFSAECEAHVVECIHEAEVFKFEVFACFLVEGKFYIEVADIIGQDGNFVSVDFVAVFVFDFIFAEVVNQIADEGACSCGGVEYFDVFIFEKLVEVFVQQVVCAFNHRSGRFHWGIDNSKPVGGFWVVGFVECFIDYLEEFLFFVVVYDTGGGCIDDVVVMFDVSEGSSLDFSGKERADNAFEPPCDIIFAVELCFIEDGVEYIFGEDVLNNHFADVFAGDSGIDAFVA